MKKLVFTLFCFIPTFAYAEMDHYAVAKPDGSMAIVHYVKGSKKPIAQVIVDLGFTAKEIKKINMSEVPSDRNDREFVTLKDGVISVDQVKKDSDKSKKQEKKAEKEALKIKLGLTENELSMVTKNG